MNPCWLFALAAAGALLVIEGRAQESPHAALVDELVTANRILFDQNVVDGFGHVSVRDPDHPGQFYIARGMSPALVTRDDIGLFDLDGLLLSRLSGRPNSERFIHAEIYRARPDVNAVVHSHSPNVIPFGVSNVPLRPIFHDASFLEPSAPVFEIRATAGDSTDMLVRTPELGRALAKSLGSANVVLMRGHGDAVVAPNLKTVVYRAVYTDVNARLQMQALALGGPVTYLSSGEAERLERYGVEVGFDRVWELWKSRVGPK